VAEPVNPLERYFRNNQGRLIHKWLHYFDIYDRHFAPHRGRDVTVLELGVYHGGSLQMWRDYFGPTARIIGVDIDPRCAGLGGDGVEVLIGDQDDRGWLRHLATERGPFDIVIDDGGHTMTQLVGSFEELWPAVHVGGVYLAEDIHTSYLPAYGGRAHGAGTFIQHVKALVDDLNAWDSEGAVPVTDWTRTIGGMHLYDKIAVFDKAAVTEPRHAMTGSPSFDDPLVEDNRL
jgi:hypothetical protein